MLDIVIGNLIFLLYIEECPYLPSKSRVSFSPNWAFSKLEMQVEMDQFPSSSSMLFYEICVSLHYNIGKSFQLELEVYEALGLTYSFNHPYHFPLTNYQNHSKKHKSWMKQIFFLNFPTYLYFPFTYSISMKSLSSNQKYSLKNWINRYLSLNPFRFCQFSQLILVIFHDFCLKFSSYYYLFSSFDFKPLQDNQFYTGSFIGGHSKYLG